MPVTCGSRVALRTCVARQGGRMFVHSSPGGERTQRRDARDAPETARPGRYAVRSPLLTVR